MKTESSIRKHTQPSIFNILIVYDQVSSAKNAKELCDRLERRTGSGYRLNLKLWSLRALQAPLLTELAKRDTESAPVLIVAVDGETHLPPGIKSWISRWGREARGFGGALVAQLHGIVKMNEEGAPVYLSLQHIAHDAGLEFVSKVIEPAANESKYSLESIHEPALMQSSWLGEHFPPQPATLHHHE